MQLFHRLFLGLTLAYALLPSIGLSQNAADEFVYVVQKGDTLFDISRRYLISPSKWEQLKQYNQLQVLPEDLPVNLALRIPNAWLGTTATNHATLEKVSGAVYVTPPKVTERLASVGDSVAVGTKIITTAHGSAVLKLADGTQINVWPLSKLLLEKLQVGRQPHTIDAMFHLPQGDVRLSVPRPPKALKSITIQTPSAVAAVQGTEFWVSSQPGRTLTQTYKGQVQVQAQGRNSLVQADEEVFVRLGAPPSSVRTQRGPPVIENLASSITTLPARLSWSSPTDAEQWGVLIAKDREFEEVVLQTIQDKPQIDWPITANGRWWVRIQALDAQQMPSQGYEQSLDVQVQRDYLGYSTIDHAQQLHQTMQIELPELQGQERYLLQLSRDSEGNDVIWSRIQDEQKLILPTMPQTATQYLQIFRLKAKPL